MDKHYKTGCDDQFKEDMSIKSEWIKESRGYSDKIDLHELQKNALTQLSVIRENRYVLRDPATGKLEKDIEITSRKKGVRATEVKSVKADDSENFISDCIEVKAKQPFIDAVLRFRPKRGVTKSHNLETAKIFVYDEKMRQWNLVEQSGYNKRYRYLWAEVYRGGIYAAIALPASKQKVREIALKQYAYLNIQLGEESGLIARSADFFDNNIFTQLLQQSQDPEQSAKQRKQAQKVQKQLHRESRKFKSRWPRQWPNNGLPEWHIIENLEETSPSLIEALGILDITAFFPLFRRLVNRVGRWYPLGPWNINGRIKSMVAHPTSSNILYAGAANGGVWKSTNAGDSWNHLWKFEDTMAVGSIAISRSHPSVLYAATGEYTPPTWGPSYPGSGIYKSTNSGDSWSNISPVSEVGMRCTRIDIHPGNPSIAFVASNSGVHRTINGGGDWDSVLSLGAASDVIIDPSNPQTIYAGLWNRGVYKSIDGGDHWDRIDGNIVASIATVLLGIKSNFPVNNDAGWIKIALGRNGNGGSNFVVAKMGQDGEQIYISANGGDSWFRLPNTQAVDYNEWCTLIAVHPNNHNRIYAGGVGLSYTDDGYNFNNTSGTHSDHHVMVFDPNQDNVCYVATDGGVYRSDDYGVHWSLRSRFLQAAQLMSMGVSDSGSFVVGCATQDQGIIQTEGSYDWDDFGGGNEWGMYVVDPNNSDNIYISPGSAELRRSTDMGRHFSTLNHNSLSDWWAAQNRRTRVARWRHVAVQPGNSQVLIGVGYVGDVEKDSNDVVIDTYAKRERIYYSADQGDTWSIALNLPSGVGTRVAYAPNNASIAYAASNDGRVYRSTNGGQSGWVEPYTAANKPANGNIMSITVDALDADRVYITYGNVNPHIYRSVDGGQSWDPIAGVPASATLPDIPLSGLVIEPENNDILYVASDIGVFRSNDAGYSWYFYNDSIGEFDLPRVLVTNIAMHKSTRRLFASTMGRGLYYTYTTGLRSLRITHISHYFHGFRFTGIQYVKATDGVREYVMARSEVIRRIEAGTLFYTIGADGSRAEVLSMPRDGRQHPQDYIKTAADQTLADNLLSLPEFYV